MSGNSPIILLYHQLSPEDTKFIENYNQNGIIEKIFINEKISEDKTKIIIAEKAKIIKSNEKLGTKYRNFPWSSYRRKIIRRKIQN